MAATAVFLSLRYLRGKSGKNQTRRRMIGAILAIAVSIIPLLLVMQVTDGMIEGITRRYVEIGTFHLQVRNFSEDEETDPAAFAKALETVEGVKLVFPFVYGTALLYSEEGSSGAMIRGLPADLYRRDSAVRNYMTITEGEYNLERSDSVIVSSEMAKDLDIHPGDSLKMLTGKSFPGRPVILRPSKLTVTGVFTTGYRELDSLSVIIPYERGAGLFTGEGAVSLGIKVDNPYGDLREIAWKINRIAPPGWYVYSWYELEKSMYKSLENTKNLLFFIMALILVVASVNISSTIVMIVMERQRDIAILKSIGSSPAIIRRTFLFTGLWIGITGTVVGLAFGVLIASNINEIIGFIEIIINGVRENTMGLVFSGEEGPAAARHLLNPDYYLENIPISVKFGNLCFVSVLSVILSLIAAFFPARKAGKTVPLTILRRF